MSDFDFELKNCFLEEAKELLADTETLFLELEQTQDQTSVIQHIFRVVHTIKGSSAASGFSDLSKFAHKLESLLTEIKEGRIALSSKVMELLLASNDLLAHYVALLAQDHAATIDYSDLYSKIEARLNQGEYGDDASTPLNTSQGFGIFDEEKPSPVSGPTQRVPEKEPHQDQHEPPPSVYKNPQQNKGPSPQSEESVRVNLARIDKLVRYVGELSTYNAVVSQFRYELPSTVFQSAVDQLNKIGKNIQDLALGLRMIPLKPTFQKMKRIIRDSAKGLGKEVELNLIGEDVEVDKTILEQLDGPLVHLIRNAVDHGIESAEERQTTGKAPIGSVTLAAYHEAGHLVLEIRDDGKGINLDHLRQKAIEKGIVDAANVLTDKEALDLIFRSGFSTKAEVTDLSGRGVGMDVVKTNIDKLSGSIAVETKLGEGSLFKITLPLTLSIIHGMVLLSGVERYVVPLAQVNKMLQPQSVPITYLTGLGEVFVLEGKTLPLLRLDRILVTQKLASKTLSRDSDFGNKGVIIVLSNESTKFGLFVNDVLGQQPIVIRKLGDELLGSRGFGGGAILGDGRAALILDVSTLYNLHKSTLAKRSSMVAS